MVHERVVPRQLRIGMAGSRYATDMTSLSTLCEAGQARHVSCVLAWLSPDTRLT